MKIGAGITAGAGPWGTGRMERESRYHRKASEEAVSGGSGWSVYRSGINGLLSEDSEEQEENEGVGKTDPEGLEESAETADRSEAEKIYQAVKAGKRNPIESLREMPKVPYGHLAKDGVIIYNGVCFVCDEESNSICLGDMTDKKNVLNIPLSGGGHLKVNRNSIGLLSKAAGMFLPEDLNLIMRAISQDTKLQAMQKEIEDEEASVGETLQGREGDSVEQAVDGEWESLTVEEESAVHG